MAIRLDDTFAPGRPIASVRAEWFRTITNFYNKLELMYGSVIRGPDGKVTLNPYQAPPGTAGGGAAFSGTAYIAGNKTTGLNSDSDKEWVRCFLDTATAEEHSGPPPNPFPSNEEWYEKAYTAGDIHIPRA